MIVPKIDLLLPKASRGPGRALACAIGSIVDVLARTLPGLINDPTGAVASDDADAASLLRADERRLERSLSRSHQRTIRLLLPAGTQRSPAHTLVTIHHEPDGAALVESAGPSGLGGALRIQDPSREPARAIEPCRPRR